MVQYGLRNLWELLSTSETKIVCIPASFLAELRETCLADLKNDDDDGSDPPFLSDGDIICAWWTRLAISHLPFDSQRTVALNNAYSLRKTLEADLLPSIDKCCGYLSNAVGFLTVLLPVHSIKSRPLGHLAKQVRRSIEEQGTRAQVEASMHMWRGSWGTLPPFFGDPGMHQITISNWSKASLFETDFSAAVVAAGSNDVEGGTKRGGSKTKLGRPMYVQNAQFGICLPNAFPIIGKDGGELLDVGIFETGPLGED
ncbi:uncharacterized protein BCR38DRAFT_509887 [Pseudomassariella vexata]|uniref:Uncharacterized protein n=1 Tax=Pseudomassariella vexata TaxID=1141098 RepID=A0A1Y2E786_9PEZI|nr:uncharacterized protein BCR38DRAFT_509887 [Pseudomassariella vexata]ORY67194.1 hypothetical protein BCR38DRAFT_509887 [Pseudomassariella vexata]